MAETPQISLTGGAKHPYHLVHPSPWPVLGAISAGALAVGMVLYMHGEGSTLLIAAGIAVLLIMAGWWRDVIRESVKEHAHTPIVKIGLRYGMVLFIASEVMFFSAFFWAFFGAAWFPTAAIKEHWPPPGITPIDPFHFPFLMTMILLLSGTTVTWAHHALIEGHRKEAIRALTVTVCLGLVFTMIQGYEYAHALFGFKDTVFASTFYMATGFHGFHVMVGTIFLAVCLFRTINGHFTPKSHFGFEAAAWYWHFVDVVWLFLFVAVYVGTAGGWWGPAAAQ